jgi:hypothetical protein
LFPCPRINKKARFIELPNKLISDRRAESFGVSSGKSAESLSAEMKKGKSMAEARKKPWAYGFMHRWITFVAPAGWDPGPIMKFGLQSVKPFSVTNA